MPKRYHLLLSILALSGLLSACQSPSNDTPTLESDIKRVIQQTLDNMVFVEGGSFIMGDFGKLERNSDGSQFLAHWSSDKDDDFLHKVTLDSFSINKYEVTWEEFDTFSRATNRPIFKAGKWFHLPEIPAYMPNWYEAKAYCDWLAKQSGLAFDLPTEAQWEFAARSRGRNVPFATNDGLIDFKGSNIKGFNVSQDEPVRGDYYPPNPLGLHHLSGNVSEYVKDWFLHFPTHVHYIAHPILIFFYDILVRGKRRRKEERNRCGGWWCSGSGSSGGDCGVQTGPRQ